MFEGTDNIERGEIDKLIQNAGGRNNAGTSYDYTMYYEILPSNQLEMALWLESERLLSLRIDTVGVETQRKVVKEERKQRYENQPYGSWTAEVFKRAFEGYPYEWTPIGEVQYIDEAKLHEFIEFHDHFYVPENAVLVVAGDFETEKTKKLVKAYFEEIPKGGHEIYRPTAEYKPKNVEIRDTVYDNIQLPAAFLVYHMPAQGTPDYYALSMLQTLLSDGESSKFYKRLVDKEQKAIQVAAFPYALENAGLFITLGLANMGVDLQEIEKLLEEEIEKVKAEGLTDKEFQKLQNITENDFISSNSTMEGIASSLANYHIFYKDAGLINTEINKFLEVTKEDIVRVAKKYLTNENRVVLYYLPKSDLANN
jgi:predicted Zn-dependent peptidase